MKRFLLPLLALALSILAHAGDEWPEVKWEALVPKGWNPGKEFANLDLSRLEDADPRAMEALEKLRQAWDDAPAEPALDGRKLRIAGFALPLERKGDKVAEFLLVPYFGACIHSPPPPANQIILARLARPTAGIGMMMPVWAFGTLTVQRGETTWGIAGYRMSVEKVEPYREPKRR